MNSSFPFPSSFITSLAIFLKWTLLSCCLMLMLHSCKPSKQQAAVSEEEWQSLFNGKDLTGWDIKITGYPVNENYKHTFVVEDSLLRVKYNEYDTFGGAYGHLYYQQPYSYYKLRFDYRFLGEQLAGGATWNNRNSGVMLHSQSAASNELRQDYPVSIEMQLLGGLGKGERHTANVCTPGTAVEINGSVDYDHCISSSSATYNGDQWVHGEAVVMGGEAMYFLVEGDTVLQFQHPQIGGGFISDSDGQSDWESFGILRDKDKWLKKSGEVLTSGYIALQAESHSIDFKNIELLNLCGCMDPKAKNYKTYYVQEVASSCKY